MKQIIQTYLSVKTSLLSSDIRLRKLLQNFASSAKIS
jgi:hypothetical protein